MQILAIPHQETMLEGTLSLPASGTAYPAVIFFHGMTSSQDKYIPMAKALSEAGIAGMTVNIRGHGKSGGNLETLTAAELESDGIAAYDFLASQKEIDPGRIGICGASFGGLIGAEVSARRAVKSLLLRAPAAYTDDMLHTKLSQLMQAETSIFNGMKDAGSTKAVRALRDFAGALLVIASENDRIIPRSIPQAFYDGAAGAAHKEFEVMQGAPHSINDEALKKSFTERTVRWFAETL